MGCERSVNEISCETCCSWTINRVISSLISHRNWPCMVDRTWLCVTHLILFSILSLKTEKSRVDCKREAKLKGQCLFQAGLTYILKDNKRIDGLLNRAVNVSFEATWMVRTVFEISHKNDDSLIHALFVTQIRNFEGISIPAVSFKLSVLLIIEHNAINISSQFMCTPYRQDAIAALIQYTQNYPQSISQKLTGFDKNLATSDDQRSFSFYHRHRFVIRYVQTKKLS